MILRHRIVHRRFIRSLNIQRLNSILSQSNISYNVLIHSLKSQKITLNLPSLVYLSIYEPSSFSSLIGHLNLTKKQ